MHFPTPVPRPAITPDAFALLADAHDQLRRRFDALVLPTWRAPPSRRALIDAGLWLNIHAALAISLVYPAVRAAAHATPTLALTRAETELRDVLDVLEELLATDASGDELAARLATLRGRLDRQFADEELAMFEQLATGELDVDALGRRLLDQRSALVVELGLAH